MTFVHQDFGDVEFARRSARDPRVFVYVLTCVGTPYLKIGISKNVITRRASIRSCCPLPILIRYVRLFASSDLAFFVEQRAHAIMEPLWHRQEWFSATEQQAIEAIRLAAPIAVDDHNRWKASKLPYPNAVGAEYPVQTSAVLEMGAV